MPQHRDKRRFERVPFFARVTVAPVAGGEGHKARTVGVSLGDVGLVCPAPLPVGSAVALTFHLPARGAAGAQDERVAGRVVRLRHDNDDAAILGVEFTPALDRRSAPGLVRAVERL